MRSRGKSAVRTTPAVFRAWSGTVASPTDGSVTDPYADLAALYPWLPRLQCGPGWHALIERLCERLAEGMRPEELRAPVLLSVMERRGRLHIRARAPLYAARRVSALLREAEEASEVTCSQCGAPGSRAPRGGWVATLCEEHEAQGMWLQGP